MRAKDIMTANVVSVSPDTGIGDAAQILLDQHISGVPVIDPSGQLVGILTEGDLMRRVELTSGRQPRRTASASSAEEIAKNYVKEHGTKVRDVMTRNVMTIDENETVDRIAMLLESRGIKRVPVMRNGKPVGIVSRANLLRAVAAGRTGGGAPTGEEIRSAILRRVSATVGGRAHLVDVTATNGVVHLWGNVASESEREAVRVVAENTKGVKEVENHIRLLPTSIIDYKPE
jgi:CBS domain-containing protein